MKYFFVLGNNSTLSIAEITSKFPKENHTIISNDILMLDSKEKIKPDKVIKSLGGTIKIGIIEKELPLNIKLKTEIFKTLDSNIKGKYKFGISQYTKRKINVKRLAMEIKKHLKEQKISSRWVTSKEKTLSSVVVTQNNLINKGIEIALIENNDKILLGKTLVVQPFKELSFRDYGRPARDDRSGMLPPKLAIILINLAKTNKNSIIIDPFCGSGTVLTEGLLMGYKNLIGSDISKKAINDSKKNIKWIIKNFDTKIKKYKLFNSPVQELSKKIKQNSVNSIITEPYLGPERGQINIKNTIPELEKLYSESLAQFYKIMEPGARIIMIFPIFNINNKKHFINPNLNKLTITNLLPTNLTKNKIINLTNRKTIIYSRPNQRIEREIIILTK